MSRLLAQMQITRLPGLAANLLCLLAVVIPLLGQNRPLIADSVARPNIVFIMADDLGYGEVGSYGQEKIRTPHLDRLTQAGMKFTHHYTGAPVCAPARCTLMTGQHLGRAEVRNNRDSGNGRVFPGQWPISAEVTTIAQVLKQAGYRTGAFGKWGLGPSNTTGSPIKKGFDRFYGYNGQRNAHSYYPYFLDSDEREVVVNPFPVPGHFRQPEGDVLADRYRSGNYAPKLILEEAVKFLDQNKDRPFFLYLPFVEPHVAMQPPQHWIDQYPTEWDAEHGAYRGENGYLPHPRPRAAYAAMISDLDQHVGTILERLEQHGLTNNTLIVFTSDNGPTHPSRDPRWDVGGAGSRFFNSAGGLKGFKGSCDEGGIRVPCIVKWPGQVQPGSETDFPSYFPDWFPTLARIAQAEAVTHQQLDGVDLTPVLLGQQAPVRSQPLTWEFHGYGGFVALRAGNWKAIRRDLLRNKPQEWELYNVVADPGETTDRAAEHPELVQRLEAAYLQHRTVNANFPFPVYDTPQN